MVPTRSEACPDNLLREVENMANPTYLNEWLGFPGEHPSVQRRTGG